MNAFKLYSELVLMAAKKEVKITIDQKLCKGCGICVEFCPKHVLRMSKKVNENGFHLCEVASPDECVACRNCEMFCPDMAISVSAEEDKKS